MFDERDNQPTKAEIDGSVSRRYRKIEASDNQRNKIGTKSQQRRYVSPQTIAGWWIATRTARSACTTARSASGGVVVVVRRRRVLAALGLGVLPRGALLARLARGRRAAGAGAAVGLALVLSDATTRALCFARAEFPRTDP